MKVISFNTGYFLGYDGTHLDYLRNPLKSLKGSSGELENLEKFLELVEENNPDFILVQEIDGGSVRTSTKGQQVYISKGISDRLECDFHRKYSGRIFPKLPIFRHMGNAVFYREGEVEDHLLDNGRKNLVQEIRTEDFSLFSLHLSTLGGWIRKRQLAEVKKIAERRQDFVIAGDLNFHKGRKEIRHLEKLLGTEVISPGKTFPAKEPEQSLDLVTGSEGISITEVEELGNRFSDHRPIMFKIERN